MLGGLNDSNLFSNHSRSFNTENSLFIGSPKKFLKSTKSEDLRKLADSTGTKYFFYSFIFNSSEIYYIFLKEKINFFINNFKKNIYIKLFFEEEGKFNENIRYKISDKNHKDSVNFISELKECIIHQFNTNLVELEENEKEDGLNIDDFDKEKEIVNKLTSFEKIQKSKIQKFILNNDYIKSLFVEKFGKIDKKNYEENLKELVKKILEFSEDIKKDIENYTKNVPDLNFNPFILKSIIENFFFSHFNFFIQSILKKTNKEKNEKFLEEIQNIKKRSLKEKFDFLEIKEKYRLYGKKENKKLPYSSAINELKKIPFFLNPKQKLTSLINLIANMKKEVIRYHNSAFEINSMDDELPILIFIITFTDFDIYNELEFLKIYIEFLDEADFEKRFLSNFEISCEYITNDWKKHEEERK